ncbi:autophagy protein atg9 [Massospora cicadina]|nr:autophagy protein atg9 [Massospora cicadina]
MSYRYTKLEDLACGPEGFPSELSDSNQPLHERTQMGRPASPASEPDDSFLLEVPPASTNQFSRGSGDDSSADNRHSQRRRRSRRERLENVVQPYDFQWERAGPLDHYLERVYRYYEGRGLYCIVLSNLLNLATLVFVVSFATFAGGCLDFEKLEPHRQLGDAVIGDCLYRLPMVFKLGLAFFLFIALWQAAKMVYDARDLLEMFHFYTKVLGIQIWAEVVRRMSRLPSPVSKAGVSQPLDAYQVTQRIMRLDNYFIALVNLEKFDLSYPIPSILGGGALNFSLTRGLEWGLTTPQRVLMREERAQWAGKFRRKLQFMGFINLVLGPFVVLYTLCFVIFRYFEEYYKTPKNIGLRQYTVLAKWQVREFNELPHYLRQRLDASRAIAEEYLDQFPRIKTVMVTQFLVLVLGTLAGACALLALVDSELVLQLEVLPGWSVFSCGATLGIALAALRAPAPSTADPQVLLAELLEQLHYMPELWRDRLHSDRVRQEFSKMYSLKLMQLVHELLGLVLTPFLLLFVIPRSCYDVVDLFRECTTHLPSVGHVCSLAQFDSERHGPNASLPNRYKAQHGKLEKSLLTFKAHNPEWVPLDPVSSIYLSKLTAGINQLAESVMSQSSQLEEPVGSNPFSKPMPMRILAMMLEQPQRL